MAYGKRKTYRRKTYRKKPSYRKRTRGTTKYARRILGRPYRRKTTSRSYGTSYPKKTIRLRKISSYSKGGTMTRRMMRRPRRKYQRKWRLAKEKKYKDFKETDFGNTFITNLAINRIARLDMVHYTAQWTPTPQVYPDGNWALWPNADRLWTHRYSKMITSADVIDPAQGSGYNERNGNKIMVTGGNIHMQTRMPNLSSVNKASILQFVIVETKRNINSLGQVQDMIPWTAVYEDPLTWRRIKPVGGVINPSLQDVRVIRKKKYVQSSKNDYYVLNEKLTSLGNPIRATQVNFRFQIPKRIYTFQEGTTSTTNYYWEMYAIYSTEKCSIGDGNIATGDTPKWDTDLEFRGWSEEVAKQLNNNTTYYGRGFVYNPQVALRVTYNFSDQTY